MNVRVQPLAAIIALSLLAACSADGDDAVSTPVPAEPTQAAASAIAGVTCETSDAPKDGLRALPGRAGEDICVVWVDSYSDESGFEVILEYPSEGARMTYKLPPDTEVFIFPAADQPRALPSAEACQRRTNYSVQVMVHRGNGPPLMVGGFAADGHCGQD